MGTDDAGDVNERTRAAWERNAGFWDEWMGDAGNDFQRLLVWAPAERLLGRGIGCWMWPAGTAILPAGWRRGERGWWGLISRKG